MQVKAQNLTNSLLPNKTKTNRNRKYFRTHFELSETSLKLSLNPFDKKKEISPNLGPARDASKTNRGLSSDQRIVYKIDVML